MKTHLIRAVFFTLSVVALLAAGRVAAAETPATVYRQAFQAAQEADAAFEAQRWTVAAERYQAALKDLDRVQQQWPQWSVQEVAIRVKHCRFQVRRATEHAQGLRPAVPVTAVPVKPAPPAANAVKVPVPALAVPAKPVKMTAVTVAAPAPKKTQPVTAPVAVAPAPAPAKATATATVTMTATVKVSAKKLTPRQQYEAAYELSKTADAALAKADFAVAAKQYSAALRMLEELKSAHPLWQPERLEMRVSHCRSGLRLAEPPAAPAPAKPAR